MSLHVSEDLSADMNAADMNSEDHIPLTAIPAGAMARIVQIDGGRRMTRRCLALGLRVGAEVTVSHARGHGVVVACDGNRVALGREMARHVLAELVG